jgi:hypothetical protein
MKNRTIWIESVSNEAYKKLNNIDKLNFEIIREEQMEEKFKLLYSPISGKYYISTMYKDVTEAQIDYVNLILDHEVETIDV